MGEPPLTAHDGPGRADPSTGGEAERVFRATDPIAVRQPIRGSVSTLRTALADHVPEGGAATTPDVLLPGSEVYTCSLFIENLATDEDAGDSTDTGPAATLSWFLEIPKGAAGWNAPVARLLEDSPVFEDGDVRSAIDHGRSQVFSADDAVFHERLPGRPADPAGLETVLLWMPLRAGLPTLATRAVTGLVRAVRDTWLEDRFEAAAVGLLEDEGMWTETIWLVRAAERFGGADPPPEYGDHILWYMEADAMTEVMEAYDGTDNPVGRAGGWLANHVFPVQITDLDDPGRASSFDRIVHLTAPERP